MLTGSFLLSDMITDVKSESEGLLLECWIESNPESVYD